MGPKSEKFEFGEFSVEPHVLEEIAALAATKVDGVSHLASGGITGRLTKKGGAGVTASKGDDHIDLEIHLIARYGRSLREIGRDVQASVKEAVESMTGQKVSSVNVFVDGIVFPEETDRS